MKSLLILFVFLFVTLIGKSTTPLSILNHHSNKTLVITAMGECEKFLWLGTNQGLYQITKSNGKRKRLTEKNSRLPNNYVTSIACASGGQTYIGTKNGILLWDKTTFLLLNTENSNIPDGYITALAVDRDDSLWIGTYNSGLVKCTGNPIKSFMALPVEFNNEKVFSITIDSQGCVWTVFNSGKIACLQNGEWHIYTSIQTIEKINLNSIGRFILNIPEYGAYLGEGSSFKHINGDSTYSKIMWTYFSPKYRNMILCSEQEIYILNITDPSKKPAIMSYREFFNLVYSLYYNL